MSESSQASPPPSVALELEEQSLKIAKLKAEIHGLTRPFYVLPTFWFSLSTAILAVVGVIAQGYLSRIDSRIADLKIERVEKELGKKAAELDEAIKKKDLALAETATLNEELLASKKKLEATKIEIVAVEATLISARDISKRTGFNVKLEFKEGLSDSQKKGFEAAVKRWSEIITGDLPDFKYNEEYIDDLKIEVSGLVIDGPGNILGQAGPHKLRPTSGAAALLPAVGKILLDIDDLKVMEEDGTLEAVLNHEIGRVLGLGPIWDSKKLIENAGSNNPVFTGPKAMAEYAALIKSATPVPVPLENVGGVGSRDSSWRTSVFGGEIMAGFVRKDSNRISRLTIAALEDMGYQVNYKAADEYELPYKEKDAKSDKAPE